LGANLTTAAFAITTPSTTAKLDASRKTQVAFTVTNASIQPMKGRARVVPMDVAKPEWFAIDGDAERAFASSGTQQYTVRVNVPATAPAGTYKFQLKVVGVANPDEQYGESQQVAFEVPQPVKTSKPLPWIWIVAALVALLVLGVGGFALYKALNPDKAKLTVAPASLSFDPQDVGTTSKSKTITLTNSGSADLRLQAASFAGGSKDFPLTNDRCSNKTIKANASCGVDIAFAPLTTGSPTTKLTFANSAGPALEVTLTGTASVSRPGLYSGNWYPNQTFASGVTRMRVTATGGFLTVQTYCPNPPAACTPLSGVAQFTTEPVLVPMSSGAASYELNLDQTGNNLTVAVVYSASNRTYPVGFHRLNLVFFPPIFLSSPPPSP
jgi:hypothetical protein